MGTAGGPRIASRLLGIAAIVAAATPSGAAAEDAGGAGRPIRAGVQVDLFPTVVSAVNGELGYAPQVWVGIDPVRLRLIGARLEPPDAFAFDEDFEDPTSTVLAAVVDYSFGEGFTGWWVSAGLEVWERTVRHERSSEQLDWTSLVATVGAGYVWHFARGFYLDPWLGVHATLDPEVVEGEGIAYEPPAIVANASVKIGWSTSW